MKIQDAYTQWSTTYDADRNLTRDLDQHVTTHTLANLQCQSVLEIGCGTGKNTAFVAQISRAVQALDFSAGMLAQARAKVSLPNVIFTRADLTHTWPCKDQSVDLIVCNLVLEHIADLDSIFVEASRTLAAGGHFFVCELHPFRQYRGSQAQFQQAQDTIDIPAFVHHISDFTNAAEINKLSLLSLKEWWHEADQAQPPRLVSFMFEKRDDHECIESN